jgi:hypothetical protein
MIISDNSVSFKLIPVILIIITFVVYSAKRS